MNFLAEVLSTAGEVQLASVKENIPKVISKIGRLKCEVTNFMKNNHVDYKQMKNTSNNLLCDATKLNTEMQELRTMIENLTKKEIEESKLDLINLQANLDESSYALKLITQLVVIDDYLKKAKECLYKKSYLQAINNIKAINKILKDIPVDERLDIIKALTVSVTVEHENILYEARKVWDECVILDKKILDDENAFILTIKINCSRSDELSECIEALCFENSVLFELQCLANFLMKEIFTSIINHHCEVGITNNNTHSILEITVKNDLPKQNYTEVFNNISSVFESFLTPAINFQIQKDLLLLGYVGHKINKQFCDLLIKNCLVDTIPSTAEELAHYDKVSNEIEALQTMFKLCQFFNDNNDSILKYAKNVDVLFANKACNVYLEQAKIILRKDLHDMVEVEEKEGVPSFQKCFISKNVQEYLTLVRKILDQANESSELCAGRFVYMSDQIITFYYSLVPEYHKKLLDSIPQQVALFHNNCLYLAYQLAFLNKYNIGDNINIVLKNANFLSHLEPLKTTATDMFNKYVNVQVTQIEDILKDSEFARLGQTDKLDPNCEKSIRQCLRQLELLKTVWQKVLSYEIYNKSIGELLNSFVGFLVKLVIGVEDISADNCTLLVDVYGIVKNRGPKLFTEPKEINLYVRQWYKFNELILLLNSSLTDINDRWADGKGPLAVEFKPDEVKGLIRALFQNTDRRSAILTRIN